MRGTEVAVEIASNFKIFGPQLRKRGHSSMNAKKYIIALGITSTLAVGQNVLAQEPGGDSAYQWGRWAVLSPAAGGEPFRAPDAPGSDFNARPSDADAFQPEVLRTQVDPPVITDPGDRPRPTPPPSVTDPGDRPRPTPPS